MPSAAAVAAANAVAALLTPAPSAASVLALATAFDGPLPYRAVQDAAQNVATLTDNTVALFTTDPDGGANGDGMVTIRGTDGVGVPVPGYRKAVQQVTVNAEGLSQRLSAKTLLAAGVEQDGLTDDGPALQAALYNPPSGPFWGQGTPTKVTAALASAAPLNVRDLKLAPVGKINGPFLSLGSTWPAAATTFANTAQAGDLMWGLTSTAGLVVGQLVIVTMDQPVWVMQDGGCAVRPFITRIRWISGNIIEVNDPLPLGIIVAAGVTSITVSGTTATVTTAAPHGIPLAFTNINGVYPQVILGAPGQAGLNGSRQIVAVPSATTFQVAVAAGTPNGAGPLSWSWNHAVIAYANSIRRSKIELEIDATQLNPAVTILSIQQANQPVVATAEPHGFNDLDYVTINGPTNAAGLNVGMFEIHSYSSTVHVLDPTHFQLTQVNSSGFSAYVSGTATVAVQGQVVAGLFEDCDIDLTVTGSSGTAFAPLGLYNCEVRIRTAQCGNQGFADVDPLAFTQCEFDVISDEPGGFGPTFSGGNYAKVSVLTTRAKTGRGTKFARCGQLDIEAIVTTPEFNGCALAWGTRHCSVRVRAYGSTLVSPQNGGIWLAGSFNTDNTIYAPGAAFNTSSNLEINDTDDRNQIIGSDIDPSTIHLSGSATQTTTIIDRFQITAPAAPLTVGKAVVGSGPTGALTAGTWTDVIESAGANAGVLSNGYVNRTTGQVLARNTHPTVGIAGLMTNLYGFGTMSFLGGSGATAADQPFSSLLELARLAPPTQAGQTGLLLAVNVNGASVVRPVQLGPAGSDGRLPLLVAP